MQICGHFIHGYAVIFLHDGFNCCNGLWCHSLNDIYALHAVGLYWVPGHVGVRGNETADGLARNSCTSGFVGPELALGVSRQDLRNKISC
jgi:hypothetical protein